MRILKAFSKLLAYSSNNRIIVLQVLPYTQRPIVPNCKYEKVENIKKNLIKGNQTHTHTKMKYQLTYETVYWLIFVSWVKEY